MSADHPVNRISGGGFSAAGQFYTVPRNRAGEAYPIHGDGWLQAWTATQPNASTLVMSLGAQHFQGNPYHYRASQTFALVDGGLDQTLSVTHPID